MLSSRYGEVVPLGPNYLPSYAGGVRAGLRELAPRLLGADVDAAQVAAVNDLMDFHLKGHPYVKSPLDVACWDALGKAAGLPAATLLGGRRQDSVKLYRAIPQRSPDEMARMVDRYRAEGYRRFQLKLGGAPMEDVARLRRCRAVLDSASGGDGDRYVLVGDANTGWTSGDALRVSKAVRDLDVYLEQPCATPEECRRVRRHTDLPLVMDESVHDVRSLLEVAGDGGADVVNVKISKFGGLTRAKQVRAESREEASSP